MDFHKLPFKYRFLTHIALCFGIFFIFEGAEDNFLWMTTSCVAFAFCYSKEIRQGHW